jgi:hypothetical protein
VRILAPVAVVLLLASCSLVQERAGGGPVRGKPSAEPGTLQYEVGRLTFQAPDAWEARGNERRLTLVHPDEKGRLEVQLLDRTFADEKACLVDGDDALAKGAGGLTNVRRHASTFAGRKAVTQEADSRGWHGWAWAVCDGGQQYRVFFTGQSPVAPDVLAAWRTFTRSAAIAGPAVSRSRP